MTNMFVFETSSILQGWSTTYNRRKHYKCRRIVQHILGLDRALDRTPLVRRETDIDPS